MLNENNSDLITTGTTPGGSSRLADIHVVELAQLDAVDRHQLAVEPQLLLDDSAEAAADVAVDHQHEQLVSPSRRRRELA